MKDLSGILATMALAPLAILIFFAFMTGSLAWLPGPLGWRVALAIETLAMVGFAVRYAVWLYRITEKK